MRGNYSSSFSQTLKKPNLKSHSTIVFSRLCLDQPSPSTPPTVCLLPRQRTSVNPLLQTPKLLFAQAFTEPSLSAIRSQVVCPSASPVIRAARMYTSRVFQPPEPSFPFNCTRAARQPHLSRFQLQPESSRLAILSRQAYFFCFFTYFGKFDLGFWHTQQRLTFKP